MNMQSSSAIALISVHSDPANETDNQNVYVRQVGEALSRLGWQVDMFTRQTSPSQADIVYHNERCRTIRLNAGSQEFIPREKLIGYLPQFLSQLRRFQLDRGIKYRLIHTNYWLSAWVGMELKKLQPVKHVHTYHTLGAVKYRGNSEISDREKIRLTIEQKCLETADLTIATCPEQRDYLRELVSDKGAVEIVPWGTDPDLFGSISRVAAKKKLQIAPNIFNVLYVGEFDLAQGLETLIKAIANPHLHAAADLRLTLVNNSHYGSPWKQNAVEKFVTDLGLDSVTTFVKTPNSQELATHYAAADVCVVPSHYDPSGMVAIEAMASGTPAIASNIGGLKYVVEQQQTGFLFPSQNTTVLSKLIYKAIVENEWRCQSGIAARERVENLFTWDIVASQLDEFYTELFKAQNLDSLNKSWRYSMQSIKA